MKHIILSRLLQFGWLLLFLVCLLPWYAWGQCESFQVMHFSGTQQVGCVDVTVTNEGSAGFNSFCGYGPYGVGNFATGSYTFTFFAANPDVCTGDCTTVTANFTVTAPFTLTYTSPVSGSVTQIFSSNTGTFQVCTAAGAPPGSFSVEATALIDAWCVCQ